MTHSRTDWLRVTRHRPCPICGRPDWCLFVGSPTSPEAVICARVESGKRCGEAGWLHQLIEAIVLLHQYQRQSDENGRLIATSEDYELARFLLKSTLARALGRGVSDAALRFYQRLVSRFGGQDFDSRQTYSDESVRHDGPREGTDVPAGL